MNHVAIIMDGNGRWARARGRGRAWGHVRGASRVPAIVEAAADQGVGALTLYAFSTENWSRPEGEVGAVLGLLAKHVRRERRRILEGGIRFRVMGRTEGLPAGTRELVSRLEDDSRQGAGLMLTFAFGYGGRREIVDAVNRCVARRPGAPVTERDLAENLYCPHLPDVDLLIRTGGERRISNFLLWRAAYAELHFTATRWPDFGPPEFASILGEARRRERRFGTALPSGATLERARAMALGRERAFAEAGGP